MRSSPPCTKIRLGNSPEAGVRAAAPGTNSEGMKLTPTQKASVGIVIRECETQRQMWMGARLCSTAETSLRLVPGHPDDILCASVLKQQRHVLRRQAKPETVNAGRLKCLQVRDLLGFSGGNGYTLNCRIGEYADEINKVAVVRPRGIAEKPFDQRGPLLRFEVEQRQTARIGV